MTVGKRFLLLAARLHRYSKRSGTPPTLVAASALVIGAAYRQWTDAATRLHRYRTGCPDAGHL